MPTVSRLSKSPSGDRVFIVSHPLLKEHVSFLREAKTPLKDFKWHLEESAKILLYELLRAAPGKKFNLQTPLTQTEGETLAPSFVLVAILRAGLGMLEGMRDLLPQAQIGHIGMFRNEDTLQPVHYYTKIPKIQKNAWVILVDPMLATGGSAIEAISILKKHGAKKIKMISLIAAKKGVAVLRKNHPDVELFIGAIDPVLNNKGYIVPGLGDCGDRLFGT